MEWVPTVFIAFKVSVLAIGMFYAVKWHYDKARREQGPGRQRALLLTSGVVAVVFVLLVVGLVLLTLSVGERLGLDLSGP